MTFLSYPFLWLLLPLGLAAYWCMPRRARIPVLLVLNVIFYTYHSRWRFWLLLLSIFITYFGALGIEAHRDTPAAKRWLTATLTANFSLLLVFKLQPLLRQTLNALMPMVGTALSNVETAALPMGLSFFIFSGCGYVLDVYWQHTPAQKDFLRHAAFISFFPTIAAGPILRGGYGMPSLRKTAARLGTG